MLAPIRDSSVRGVGIGNLVPNLRAVDWGRPESGYEGAERFDAAAREVLTGSPVEIAPLCKHGDWPAAVPTPEHFLPLAYVAGLAAVSGARLTPLVHPSGREPGSNAV